MVFTANIGNTRVTMGLFEDDRLLYSTVLTADTRRCMEEYTLLIEHAFRWSNADLSKIESIILSSVVPSLTGVIASAVRVLINCEPVIVGAGIKTGLDIKIDQHTQLGADIVANTVAAKEIIQPPFAVIDISDATTITAVNQKSELSGVIITAGLRMSLDSLSANAAELPYVSLSPPKFLFGKNTADSMISGAIFGHAGMIDSLSEKISIEFNSEKVNFIATGFHASVCLPYCKHHIEYDPALTLKGLNKINAIHSRIQKRYIQP